MKILFLSHYFPPEVNAPASRTYEHCKSWTDNGHQVTVVTCAPNHPKGKVFAGYKNHLYHRETIDGIDVIRLWTFVTANEGVLKRTFNYISFMLMAILVVPFLKRPDIVVSTSPQFFNGLAGYFVSRLKRAKWVLEIRDLWPESIVAVGAIRNRKIIDLLESVERFAYEKADHIVTVTQSFKQYMQDRGIREDKISVIYNGANLQLFKADQTDTDKETYTDGLNALKSELKNKFVASYVGTHGMAHHLDTLLEAAELLQHRTDIVFLMVGDGAEKTKLVAKKHSKKLDNVIMLDQLPKQAMPHIWQLSDVSIVHLKRCKLFKTVIPSKIFESMAMSKPILLGVEGEVKNIIEAGKCGLLIEPENSRQMAEGIVQLANNKEYLSLLGKNGRRYVTTYFDRNILAGQFEVLMSTLLEEPKPILGIEYGAFSTSIRT